MFQMQDLLYSVVCGSCIQHYLHSSDVFSNRLLSAEQASSMMSEIDTEMESNSEYSEQESIYSETDSEVESNSSEKERSDDSSDDSSSSSEESVARSPGRFGRGRASRDRGCSRGRGRRTVPGGGTGRGRGRGRGRGNFTMPNSEEWFIVPHTCIDVQRSHVLPDYER